MSYIRSISNPEGLYIYNLNKDDIEIIEDNKVLGTIPKKIFMKLFRKFSKSEERVEYKGGEIQEVWSGLTGCPMAVLRYRDINIEMYYVTYFLILTNINREYKRLKKCQ